MGTLEFSVEVRERSAAFGRSVNRSIIRSSGKGEGVAHTSGSHSRHHCVRVADGDIPDCHIAGQELGQGLHASAGSAIEWIAHGSRVRILAIPQAAEARRVLAPGRFVLLHLYTLPRNGKAIPLACCRLFLPFFLFFLPAFRFFFARKRSNANAFSCTGTSPLKEWKKGRKVGKRCEGRVEGFHHLADCKLLSVARAR